MSVLASAGTGADGARVPARLRAAPVTIAVSPVGRLDGAQSQRFRRDLALLSVVEGAHVLVELGAVPAMDDAAARSIADARARLVRSGGRLTVRRLRFQPREKLRAVGVRPDLQVLPGGQAGEPRSSGGVSR